MQMFILKLISESTAREVKFQLCYSKICEKHILKSQNAYSVSDFTHTWNSKQLDFIILISKQKYLDILNRIYLRLNFPKRILFVCWKLLAEWWAIRCQDQNSASAQFCHSCGLGNNTGPSSAALNHANQDDEVHTRRGALFEVQARWPVLLRLK